MKPLAVRAAVALLAFVVGVVCALPWGRAGGFAGGASNALAAMSAGVVCFGLVASSERARRRGAASDVAPSLVLLCLGFFLTVLGLGMFLRALVLD